MKCYLTTKFKQCCCNCKHLREIDFKIDSWIPIDPDYMYACVDPEGGYVAVFSPKHGGDACIDYEPKVTKDRKEQIVNLYTEKEDIDLRAYLEEVKTVLIRQVLDHRKCPKCGHAFIPVDMTTHEAGQLIRKTETLHESLRAIKQS